LAALVLPVRQGAKHSASLVEPEALAARSRQYGWIVAGIRIGEGAVARIEDAIKESNESAWREIFAHHCINPSTQLIRVYSLGGRCSDGGLQVRHYNSGWYAFAGNICDADGDFTAAER